MNELIEKYYKDIRRWSYAKTKNNHEAEDLTQEIIYQILSALSKSLAIKETEKYIWKIAYYTWCNKVNEYTKHRKNIITNDELIINAKDNSIDIERAIELEELKDSIEVIINSFSPKMQSCLRLYYYDYLSIKEISIRLEIKESLVKYYLFEARKKMRSELNEQ